MSFAPKVPEPISRHYRHYRTLIYNGAYLVHEIRKDDPSPSIAIPFPQSGGGEVVYLPGRVVAIVVGRDQIKGRARWSLNDMAQAFSCPIVVEGE